MDDLLLYGPPGTGKTTSGLDWLAARVEEGADLRRAAFVSFTNAAVDEAKERLCKRFGVTADDLPYCRTLHSLCRKVLGITGTGWLADERLEAFGDEYGYDLKKARRRTAAAADDDDLEAVAERSGADAPHLKVWDFGRHRLLFDAEDAWQAYVEYCPEGAAFVPLGRYLALVADYETWKGVNALRDYADLLWEYCRDGRPLPVSVAVVDEAQDLSPLLWQAADLLFAQAEYRATLGDDDQAIYCFGGAAPELMNCRRARQVVKLSQSYRLPQAVAAAALSIISRNDNREPKVIRPRAEPGSAERAYFLEDLDWLNGESWFLLVRNWRLLDSILPRLEAQGVPYRMGGGRYCPWSDKGPLRAVRAILKLSAGEAVTLAELLPLTERTSTQRKELVGAWSWGAKKRLEDRTAREPGAVASWRDLPALGMTTWGFERVMRRDFSLLTREISDRDMRAYQAALERGTLTREATVRVGSIHGGKGQEADNSVCPLVCTGGPARAMRHPARLEEERRVAYVGVTRARQHFYGLVMPPATGLYAWEILGV